MMLFRWIALTAAFVLLSPAAYALKTLSLDLTSYPAKPVSGQVLTYQATWRAGTGRPCFGDLVITLPSSGVTFQSSNPGGSYNASARTVTWSGVRFHNNRGSRWARVVVDQASGALPNASARITGGCSASSGPVPGPDVTPGTAPILALDKMASRQNASPGDQIVYTLDYENTGNAAATSVTLTDALPAGTSFISATGGGTFGGGSVTWSLGTVPSGASNSVSATVKVNSNVANGAVLSNNASLVSAELPTVPAGPADTVVTSQPILSFSKQAPSTHVSAGQQFTYTIGYANNGSATATNLVLTDSLPPELSFVAASDNGQPGSGGVTWSLPDLDPGRSHAVTLTVQVASPIANGTVLSNDATIASVETGALPVQTTDVTVDSGPVLELDKTVSRKTADAGDQLVYTLSYRNIGSDTATNVELQDVLPPETSYVSASSGGVLGTNQQVDWSLGSLPAGASGSVTLIADIDSPIQNGTQLHNTASLQSAEFTIPATAFADTLVSSAPSFRISKIASKRQVQAGDQVVYTITYQNTGTTDATGVVLQDALPADVIYVSATGNKNYDPITNRVTWNKGTVAAGGSGSVTLTVEVDSPIANGTLLKNTASIDANETAPLTADVNQSIVKVSSEPVLTLDLIPSVTQASPGSTIVYTLNFGNSGSDLAAAARLNFNAPAGTKISSANAGGVPNGASVTWAIGDLAAGATGSVSVTVSVDSPLTNGTRLDASSSIKETGGHSDVATAVTIIVSAPALTISKNPSTTVVSAGGTVIYTINYANNGTDQATGVVVGDGLPPNVTFVSASGGITPSSGVLNWQVGNLAVGASGAETVTVIVDSPLSNGTQLYNLAGILSDQTAIRSDSSLVSVSSAPSLSISKTASKSIAKPGDTIVYTINYSNTGTDAATNVTIEDHLPADTNWVKASAMGSENLGIVDWNIGTVAAGASGSVTTEVTVDSPLANGTVLHNTATIDSTETRPLSTGTIDVMVSSAPILTLGKTGPVTANAGGQLTYSLRYQNIGNDTATGIVLEDHLPLETTFVSVSAGGVHAAGVIDWSLPDLPAGSSGTVTVTVDVNAPLANGTLLHNQASVDSAETAPVSAQFDTRVSSSPILDIVKSVSQANVTAGSQFTYTLDYSNSGNANASNVKIVDHLAPELTLVSATGGGVSSGSDVIWNIPSVAAGSSGSVSLTVEVNAPISDGTVIPNTSNIRADGVPASVAPLVLVTVSSKPDFTLDKKSSATTVAAGGLVTYTIDYFNQGTDVATNVLLTDQVPTNTTFKSASAGFTKTNDVLSWDLGDVPAQTGGSVSVTLEVADPLQNGTQVDNQAEITSTETPPLTASASFVVTSAPNLQLTKTSQPGTVVQAGDTETYSLVLGNTGSDAANSVVIEDVIPTGATPSNISAGGTFNSSGSSITWTVPTLAAGASVNLGYELLVPIGVVNGAAWTNNASAVAANASPVSVSNSVTVAAQPSLSITKTGGNSVNAGDNLVYSISYENTGNATAQNAVVEDIIPSGLIFVSADNNGSSSAGVVSWALGNVAPGASGTLILELRSPSGALDGTIYSNTSSISAVNAPPISARAQTVVRSHVEPDIAIIGLPTSVAPAGQAVFQINYANNGNENAPNTVLRATLPANTQFVSATGGGNSTGGEVVWPSATLNAGGTGTVEFTVNVDSPLANGTSLPSTATLTSDLSQPDSSSAAVTVSSAPLVLFAKVSDVDEAAVGQTLAFGIGVTNFGNATATNVLITDTLPAELEILSADSGGVIDNNANTVTWNIGDLPPNGTAVILTVQTRLTARAPSVVNAATISYNELAQPYTLTITVPVPFLPTTIPAMPPLLLLLLALLMAMGGGMAARSRTTG
ncbi:beta strand repeat-containing protein [Candidatus Marimicrobium litorale]|nr:hypothetical protein [Candidatus Marimicrobium litorale]